MWPASACPHCGRELSWYENIPIVSYLVLRAPLPHVQGDRSAAAIRSSRRSPPLMFVLAWWQYGPGPLLVARLIFGCALIVLFAIDLEHHLLPNVITLPGIVVGLGVQPVRRAGLDRLADRYRSRAAACST